MYGATFTFFSIIRYHLIFVFVGKRPPKNTSEFVSKSFGGAKSGIEPYVAARLDKIPKDGLFTIGTGTTTSVESKRKRRSVSGKYINQPLEPSKDYSWFQRACVEKVQYSFVYCCGKSAILKTHLASLVSVGLVSDSNVYKSWFL